MLIRFVSDYSNETLLPIGFEAHWTEKGKCNVEPELFDLHHDLKHEAQKSPSFNVIIAKF